jgi:hypothetical protein
MMHALDLASAIAIGLLALTSAARQEVGEQGRAARRRCVMAMARVVVELEWAAVGGLGHVA